MNLIDPIHLHSLERPHCRAVITPQVILSWIQLDRMLWSAALKLRNAGLREGDRVGLTMLNPVAHLIAALALARIGVAHIAIPAMESDESRTALKDNLSLQTIVCDLEEIQNTMPGSILMNKLELSAISKVERDKLKVDAGDLTWLIVSSSGTTGLPKFFELTHRIANDQFKRFLPLFNCSKDDLFWAASRLDFLMAKRQIFFSLLSGAAIFLPQRNVISKELVALLNKNQITLACGTPSHLHQLIRIGRPIPSLRAFDVRSATVSESLRREFRGRISQKLYVVYGTSEAAALTCATPDLQDENPDTVGSVTESMELEIVDQQEVALPAECKGEIRIRGPGVITSYTGNGYANAKSFKNGWFYPGDLGYLTKDGTLVLQGRKDNLMIFDGMNIYPAEIENVLASHPGVHEVVAFPFKHERFQDIPVAAVILRQSISETELIDYCKREIGIRHPKRILILKEFPRNRMGKILTRELTDLLNLTKQP